MASDNFGWIATDFDKVAGEWVRNRLLGAQSLSGGLA